MQFEVYFDSDGGAAAIVEAEFYDLTNTEFVFYEWDGKVQDVVKKYRRDSVARISGTPMRY